VSEVGGEGQGKAGISSQWPVVRKNTPDNEAKNRDAEH
jgi:hypothetical protein